MEKQIISWRGSFGKEYSERNTLSPDDLDISYIQKYNVSRKTMNEDFLESLDRNIRILEVGCNTGNQLVMLLNMGFHNLFAIELQKDAAIFARERLGNMANILEGSAYDIPFKDNFFDLVFTSGVLIHLPPSDIHKAIDEICRCSRKYVWGFEYFSSSGYEMIPYRGHYNLLWKTDFAKLITSSHPSFALLKEKKYKYVDSENQDQMYLLQKK